MSWDNKGHEANAKAKDGSSFGFGGFSDVDFASMSRIDVCVCLCGESLVRGIHFLSSSAMLIGHADACLLSA